METVRPGLEIVENAERSTHVGLSVETFPLDNPLTSVVRGPGVSLRPTRDGGAVIADHATAASHRLTDPELLSIPKILISRAKDLLPALGDIKVRTVRIGPRVWPLDGRTVCGWLTDRVYVALTHSGVTLAPFIADCVRQELQGDEAHELVDFRPDRFEKD
jgi:glycine/D-amino acid oxidase-like deaminating enzyme